MISDTSASGQQADIVWLLGASEGMIRGMGARGSACPGRKEGRLSLWWIADELSALFQRVQIYHSLRFKLTIRVS